jgi:hypothetical protein
MIARLRPLAAALAIFGATPALAEVRAATPDAFLIETSAVLGLGREQAWQRLSDIGAWWTDGHTYSGSAANLSWELSPGGCWCERWEGGAVEHGRLLQVRAPDALRWRTELGPLQGLAVSGVMTFTLSEAPVAGHTRVTLTYRVTGASSSGLDTLATPVDRVLTEAMGRLARSAPVT